MHSRCGRLQKVGFPCGRPSAVFFFQPSADSVRNINVVNVIHAIFVLLHSDDCHNMSNKRDWTLYDIEYRNSRIEVKSTSYYQTWRADGKINPHRSFSIRKSTDASGVKCHHSDVYVFCLLDGKTEEAANPLVLENWFFYVVPTKHIDEVCGDNKTISLTKIKSLGYSSLSYSQLREAIDSALERRQ